MKAALWLILNGGVMATLYCDSTLNQRCPDGSLCTSATADCQTLGPRQCICGGAAGASVVGGEWCDSVDGNQRCADGTPCSAQFLECSNPRHCRCGSKNTGALVADGTEFCDSTLGNQRCKDGTPCDPQHITCMTPQKCACGSTSFAQSSETRAKTLIVGTRTEFCDPSANQRCMDGTPCNAQSLDCITPQTCICGSRVSKSLNLPGAAPQGSGLEFCDSTIPNQKCKDGTTCSKQFMDCEPEPRRCLCGSSPTRQLDHADHMSRGPQQARNLLDRELCDSTLGNQVCKDGTPCTKQHLDCSNPLACICGSSASQVGSSASQVGGTEMCDPTANQRCKDGSFCLAQILECVTPQSCRCGSQKNGQGTAEGELCDSTSNQRCKDGSMCSAQTLECITPQSCRCGSRRNNDLNQMLPNGRGMMGAEFCDPTANQRCSDGSICSMETLDCMNARSCRCGSTRIDMSSLPRNVQGQAPVKTSVIFGVELCDSTINQNCKDGSLCSAQTMECSSPKSCVCGSRKQQGAANPPQANFQAQQAELDRQFNMQKQQQHVQGTSNGANAGHGVEYCDSTLGDKCKDGTPCSSQFIDCSNPLSCVCGSRPSGGPVRDVPVQRGSQVRDVDASQDNEANQGVSNGQWGDWVGARKMQARQNDGSIKPKVEYCDSTLHQKCKDGVSCSPQYLDCTTKGPKRCICGSSFIGGNSDAGNIATGNFEVNGNVGSPRNVRSLPVGNFNVGDDVAGNFNVGNFNEQQQQSVAQINAGDRFVAGIYCLDNDLYFCDQLQECAPRTRCLNGCVSAPVGQPDYCITPNNQYLQQGQQQRLNGLDSRLQSQNQGSSKDSTKRAKYCDSLANPPQKCADRRPCSPQYLDCVTKGPNRCICEGGFDSNGNFIAGPSGSSSGPIEIGRPLGGPIDSPLGGSIGGQNGGLIRGSISDAIGGSVGPISGGVVGLSSLQLFSGAPNQDSSRTDNKGWFGAGLYCMGNSLHYCSATQQCTMAEQCTAGCFSAPSSLPDYCVPGQDLSYVSRPQRKASSTNVAKTGVKYCDSLANPPERCQDAVPCSPQYLDCTTKGPRRCICQGESSSNFVRSLSNVSPTDVFQRRPDGNLDHVGDDWNGPGLYCNEQTSDLVYCNTNFECRLAEHCQRGCLNAPGVMGYCIKGADYLG